LKKSSINKAARKALCKLFLFYRRGPALSTKNAASLKKFVKFGINKFTPQVYNNTVSRATALRLKILTTGSCHKNKAFAFGRADVTLQAKRAKGILNGSFIFLATASFNIFAV